MSNTQKVINQVCPPVSDLSTLPPVAVGVKEIQISIENREGDFPMEIRLVQGRGRGFFATRDIEAGEEVFRALPASSAISEDWMKNVCSWCFAYNDRKHWKIKGAISAKSKACYCSEKCRDESEEYVSLAQDSKSGLSESGQALSFFDFFGSLDGLISKRRNGLFKNIGRGSQVSNNGEKKPSQENWKLNSQPSYIRIADDAALLSWLDKAWDGMMNDQVFLAKSEYFVPEQGQTELIKLIAMIYFRYALQKGGEESIAVDADDTHESTKALASDSTLVSTKDLNLELSMPQGSGNLNVEKALTQNVIDIDQYADQLRAATSRANCMIPPTLGDIMLMQSNELPYFRSQYSHMTAGGDIFDNFTPCQIDNGDGSVWSPPSTVGSNERGGMLTKVPANPTATELLHHYLPHGYQDVMHLYLLCVKAADQFDPEGRFPQMSHKFFREMFFREMANSFGIWDPPVCTSNNDDTELEYLGFAIYPTAVFFNHSCQPSVTKKRENRVMTFVASKEIKKDEELYISYGSVSEPFKERRTRLFENYFFVCGCEKCLEEELQELTI
ncbi:hypothetical protein H4219_000500 [Mycoemilia scoparia]|uniref:SET domain-containing protein n=1 Tax=Mycoemilia scoparia TaxID=417184 RepID=A0A9W8A2Y5_9FUNG|nr:hypothetical protein H4219_000500 [Mycoemilia scoparia]